MKLRTLPVLASALPLAESTTAYVLGKAGLPNEMDALETSYITTALSKLDDYIEPCATTTVKYAETVKEKCSKATDKLGSRPEHIEGYKNKVKGAVDSCKTCALEKVDAYKGTVDKYKTNALEKVDSCKTTAVSYYDDVKEKAAGYKEKVSSLFTANAEPDNINA